MTSEVRVRTTLATDSTIELLFDDLIVLLDHLKIIKTLLCSFSMDDYLALRAFKRSPDRFSELVLYDTMSAADSMKRSSGALIL